MLPTKGGEQQERCYSITGRLSQYFALAVRWLAIGVIEKSYKNVYYSYLGNPWQGGSVVKCALINTFITQYGFLKANKLIK
ncbi:hypothetical protein [Pectobacterium parmentieri]|uniref:hypothetical protein n=1 Tax=Pectobacterium parmentieri TaxID=1905730 RepID=UPI000F8D24C2|nr:hypothetical protein [Pectobacterium parmentieri]